MLKKNSLILSIIKDKYVGLETEEQGVQYLTLGAHKTQTPRSHFTQREEPSNPLQQSALEVH